MTGEVPCYGGKRLTICFSKSESRYCLETYLLHLVATAAGLGGETHFISGVTFEDIMIPEGKWSPSEARDRLGQLMAYYREGQREVLAYSPDLRIDMAKLADMDFEGFSKTLVSTFNEEHGVKDPYLIREYGDGFFDSLDVFERYRELATDIYVPCTKSLTARGHGRIQNIRRAGSSPGGKQPHRGQRRHGQDLFHRHRRAAPVVEKELPLKEILMVTFTKAAVAELETRIRDFVRLAAAAARGTQVADEAITRVVSRAVAEKGAPRVTELLTAAVLLLDETSVMTIHSFCQQTLSEFALETGQLFGSETLDDVQALIDAEVNKSGGHASRLSLPELGVLCDNGLTRKNLSEVLSAYFSEKRYLDYEPSEDYQVEPGWLAEQWDEILPLLEREEALTGEMCRQIAEEQGWVRAATQSNSNAKKAFGQLHDDPEKFIKTLGEKRDKGYVQKLYAPLLTTLTELDEVTAGIRERSQGVISRFFCQQIRVGAENLEAFKDRNGVLSFDDMITRLHAAVLGPGAERLIRGLRGKYKAVFIDEFQDTDKKQYEIFSTAFGEETLLFYIGDPKQSIYGWRKADISTYLKARAEVAARYSMNVNYRSSGAFIASMNRFFLPVPEFDTFAFAGEADGFSYTPVDAPAKQIPRLRHDATEVVPLKILYGQKKDEILETLPAACWTCWKTAAGRYPARKATGRWSLPISVSW